MPDTGPMAFLPLSLGTEAQRCVRCGEPLGRSGPQRRRLCALCESLPASQLGGFHTALDELPPQERRKLRESL